MLESPLFFSKNVSFMLVLLLELYVLVNSINILVLILLSSYNIVEMHMMLLDDTFIGFENIWIQTKQLSLF